MNNRPKKPTIVDVSTQYDFIFDIVSKRLKEQLDSLDSVLQKANIMITIIGIAIAGYIQLVISQNVNFKDYPFLMVLETTFIIVSLYFGISAFILKPSEGFRNDPNPKGLLEAFSQEKFQSVYFIKDDILRGMSEAYEHNSNLITAKHTFLYKSAMALFIAFIVLAIHLVIISELINLGCIINNLKNLSLHICN